MKSKILLAVALLLAISTTTVWAADSSEKTNQKTGSYTNEDVWAAYEGFNNTLLDPDKYIYKTTSSYEQAVDRGHGAAAIWCQPIYWDMSMNAYKLAKAQKDKKKRAYYKELCEKIFAGNKAQYCHFDFDNNNENTGWFIAIRCNVLYLPIVHNPVSRVVENSARDAVLFLMCKVNWLFS